MNELTPLRTTILGSGSVGLAMAAIFAEAGRRTEVDDLNGAVVRMVQERGIATAGNDAVASLVLAREA